MEREEGRGGYIHVMRVGGGGGWGGGEEEEVECLTSKGINSNLSLF